MNISFNLFNLKQQLHIESGEQVSYAQIARDTGLHRNTVERITSNDTTRVDLETLAALVSYFRSKGMNVGISDLVNVEVEEKQAA